MAQKIVQIDAFTDKPFAGNPAAVCLMETAAEEAWMQAIAAEMNLSETAFLYPIDRGYHLRWFTPTIEVELCGHATLASAHLLYEDGHVPSDRSVRFKTLGGELSASRKDGWIELDFPVTPCRPSEPPAGLAAALGADIRECMVTKSRYLIELESEAAVRSLRPNFSAIAAATDRRVIITAKATTGGLDFVSRYFAPSIGINEDPVTGSAHTVLAPYWADKLGKTRFTAFQASARGGWVKVELRGDRVLLGGQAVTVMRGELL
jgi:PhzF family phenazine biosynthesis protein